MRNNHFFVINGGPGAGKSTLITALKMKGYPCVEEMARQIIQEQNSIGGDALPWKNRERFKEMILERSIEAYKLAEKKPSQITFFDRCLLDLIAYDRLNNIKSSKALQEAVEKYPYNKTVFIAPPWKEIYCLDAERNHTYEEAVKIYENIMDVYTEYGNEIILLPKSSVEHRVTFILEAVNSLDKKE